MSKDTVTIFRVRGRGEFPIDMLRYDRCWPKSEMDSNLIQAVVHPSMWREVELMCINMTNAPTAGRWKSFGWEICEVKVDRR
jgi:hypothetical protein